MANNTDLRQLSVGELEEAVQNAKKELFNLRFQREVGQLENPRRLRIVKRDIARYKTILREIQIAQALVKDEGNSNAK